MDQSKKRILDYGVPRGKVGSLLELLVWCLPLWVCAILTVQLIVGGGDDAYWWFAMALTAIIGIACFALRKRGLGLYCLVVLLAILVVNILLPWFNRAT